MEYYENITYYDLKKIFNCGVFLIIINFRYYFK